MQKFMLIVREDLSEIKKLTDEERFAKVPKVLKWIESFG
jgi:hypothetical protein